MDIKNVPFAIQSKFANYKPNSNIPIAVKPVKVGLPEKQIEGEGNISLTFQPNPGLMVEAEVSTKSFDVLKGAVENSISLYVDTFPDVWMVTSVSPLIGKLKSVETKPVNDLSYIIFHIVNFGDYIGQPIRHSETKVVSGRIVLLAENWKITIDSTPLTKSHIKTLKNEGGYAITHVGKLEHQDSSVFTSQDGKKFLDKVAYFLAFARGFWSPSLLLMGYNSNKEEVWAEWGVARHIYPWKFVNSWFDENYATEALPPTFQSYVKLVQDSIWGDVLPKAIYWYVLSNTMRFADGALILIQSALELLSWNFLVVDKRNLSQHAFSRISADDQIRLLISHCNIPLDIPDGLSRLGKFARKLNLDGPGSLTSIRNSLVHPGKKSKKGNQVSLPSGPEIYEALSLGLWYTELTILWLLKYEGSYARRVRTSLRWAGEVETVPWIDS